MFPEINYDKAEQIWGMDVIIATTAKTDDEARALLQALQLPVPAVRRPEPSSDADTGERRHGEEEFDREEQAPARAGEAVRRQARSACRRSPNDESLSMEERFEARLKLAELPRNSAPTRIRNRCEVTGRPRAYYRKLGMSRIALRELGSQGLIPGLVKSSW